MYIKANINISFKEKSTGTINVSSDKKVTAKIHINNVHGFTATISVRGESHMPFSYLEAFQRIEDLNFKSLTLVFVRKARPSVKANAQNSIGNRRHGDKLLHFESRNVTNFSRFPSRVFQYSGKDYITYVGFSFNVSILSRCYIKNACLLRRKPITALLLNNKLLFKTSSLLQQLLW